MKPTETARSTVSYRSPLRHHGLLIRPMHLHKRRQRKLRTNGTGKLQATIRSIMGTKVSSKMPPILLDADDVNVSSYVGNTDLHRSSGNDISVQVNDRWIQDSNPLCAIEQGCSNSLPMGRRSTAVLHLVVPAGWST